MAGGTSEKGAQARSSQTEETVERKVHFPGPSPSSTYFGSSFAGFSFKACPLLLPIGRLQGVL